MKCRVIPNFDLNKLCFYDSSRYPFLLESVISNKINHYSILFANPNDKIILKNLQEYDFLTKLEKNISKKNSSKLPFSGGWFVYLSYELIGQIEPVLMDDMFTNNLPVAIAVKIPSAIIKDHKKNKTYVIDEDDDKNRIQQILSDIENLDEIPIKDFVGKIQNEDENKFLSGVSHIKDYIYSGDVFQVNLSRKWQFEFENNCTPAQIYHKLKQTNPAPFAALAQFDDFAIICSSPERLFSVNNNVIQTRPIAGTHPRGVGNKDNILKNTLINHPKERSEHIMLLDLERNDLGRVCKYGSIKVNEVMTLESYPFVHHIVSNIQGELKKNITIKNLIKALFPGGTITGCPKIRCMQIISELEQAPRGAYTGSLGYISNNGKMDFNILIRTIIQQKKSLSFRAGSGIVFDSVSEKELDETKHKAKGILKIFKV